MTSYFLDNLGPIVTTLDNMVVCNSCIHRQGMLCIEARQSCASLYSCPKQLWEKAKRKQQEEEDASLSGADLNEFAQPPVGVFIPSKEEKDSLDLLCEELDADPPVLTEEEEAFLSGESLTEEPVNQKLQKFLDECSWEPVTPYQKEALRRLYNHHFPEPDYEKLCGAIVTVTVDGSKSQMVFRGMIKEIDRVVPDFDFTTDKTNTEAILANSEINTLLRVRSVPSDTLFSQRTVQVTVPEAPTPVHVPEITFSPKTTKTLHDVLGKPAKPKAKKHPAIAWIIDAPFKGGINSLLRTEALHFTTLNSDCQIFQTHRIYNDPRLDTEFKSICNVCTLNAVGPIKNFDVVNIVGNPWPNDKGRNLREILSHCPTAKVFFHIHGCCDWTRDIIQQATKVLSPKHLVNVVCISEYVRMWLTDWCDKSLIHTNVIHTAIDQYKFNQEQDSTEEFITKFFPKSCQHPSAIHNLTRRPWVVYAGRFAPDKRVLDIQAAFEEYLDESAADYTVAEPPPCLIMVGSGPLTLRHTSDCVTIPWLEPYDLAGLYTKADLVLNISDKEGGPLSLLEALANGTRVLSTRTGLFATDRTLIKESYESNSLVHLLPTPANIEMIKLGLHHALKPYVRSQMHHGKESKQIIEYVQKAYSESSRLEKLANLYTTNQTKDGVH